MYKENTIQHILKELGGKELNTYIFGHELTSYPDITSREVNAVLNKLTEQGILGRYYTGFDCKNCYKAERTMYLETEPFCEQCGEKLELNGNMGYSELYKKLQPISAVNSITLTLDDTHPEKNKHILNCTRELLKRYKVLNVFVYSSFIILALPIIILYFMGIIFVTVGEWVLNLIQVTCDKTLTQLVLSLKWNDIALNKQLNLDEEKKTKKLKKEGNL